jgi:hypothetical protein
MVQVALVREQIDDGQRLVAELLRQGFPVTAACWVKGSEDSQWYLYLVSSAVDDEGITKAYRRVHPVVRQMQQKAFWIDPFEVKLISPTDSLAEAVSVWLRRSAGKPPTRYGGTRLGELDIEGAYIYPPLTPVGP